MSRRLKVASITSFLHIGGDQNRLLSYLEARDRERFEHIVISGRGQSEEMDRLWGPIWPRFKELGIETIDLGIPYPSQPSTSTEIVRAKSFAKFVFDTARILREREIDIVDGRCETGTVVATLAGRLAGVRAVMTTNYFPQVDHQHSKAKAWALFRGIFALTDAIVTDSNVCLEAMRKWMILPPPGYCIPNGLNRPRTDRSPDEVAAELGIPAGAKVVAQIARIQPYKGQEVLLEAALRVLREQPDAFFLVCGYPAFNQTGIDFRDRLIQTVASQGVGDRFRVVSYPGSTGDIWPLVDIHAHPTLMDSSPIALYESMSFGKPAVTTDVGGISDLVIDGETGIILPPGQSELVADAILRLLKNPDEAARLGQNARRRYETFYTSEIMARRIENLFEQIYATPRIRRSPAPRRL